MGYCFVWRKGSANFSRRFAHEKDPFCGPEGGRFFQRSSLLTGRFSPASPAPYPISHFKEMTMRLPHRGWCTKVVCALSFLLLSAPAFCDPFTDVTLQAGVGDKGRGKGVAWADVDGD